MLGSRARAQVGGDEHEDAHEHEHGTTKGRGPRPRTQGAQASWNQRARRPKGPPCAHSPSEDPGPPVAAPCRSPCPALPLMEVRCSSECCLRPERGGIGFPAPARTSAFRPGPAVSSNRHPPRTFARSFILPRASRLLQSAATDDLLSVPRTTFRPPGGQRAPPVGFPFPHRDISRRRPLLPGAPTPRTDGPPSTFRTSSTVCSATCLAGLFRPAAASRVCPSGVCPSPRSRAGFRRPIHALLALDGGACGLTRAGDPIPVFRALLPAESAVSTEPVRAPVDPRPSWASPPPGLPSSHRESAFTPPPPATLNRNEPVTAGPRRIAGVRLGLPGTRLPTRTRFLA